MRLKLFLFTCLFVSHTYATHVMVFSPHPDDESLGCGGSIAKHIASGTSVSVVFMTSGEAEDDMPQVPAERAAIREAEARAATAVLGVDDTSFLHLPDGGLKLRTSHVDKVRKLLMYHKPKIVYVPHKNDAHPDHQATYHIVMSALRKTPGLRQITVRCYEVWTPLSSVDYCEDISDFMQCKFDALQQYTSQLAIARYDTSIKGLNSYRGGMTSHICDGARYANYAEAFHEEFIN